VADLIFPNYTEACYLTRTDYKAEGITRQEACELLDGLVRTGTHSAIITSCVIDGQHQVCGYGGHSHQYFFHDYEEIPGLFHGTGDIFSAVLIAHLLKQESLSRSTRAAMDAVSQMISRHQDTPDRMCGLPIEQSLDLL
jgi:pyridoxine kinase